MHGMIDRYASPETLAELSCSPVEVCRILFAAGKTREGIIAIRSECRNRELVRKRWAIIYMAAKHSRYAMRPIGRAINRDFSWVCRGLQQAEKLRKRDGEFRRMCEELRRL